MIFCTILSKLCSPPSPPQSSDSFLSRMGSLMTEIPARLGDFGLWNLVSSSLMAAMMGAASASVDPSCGAGFPYIVQVIYNLFHISCLCLLPIHVWIRDLRRLGNPDLLLGAGALRPAALLLLLLQLLRHHQLVGFTGFHI